MKKIILLNCLLFSTLFSWSQTDKIKTYFSRPVNNAVSTGTNAIYLNQLIDDTLIAYINRAKYSLDMAIIALAKLLPFRAFPQPLTMPIRGELLFVG